MIRHANLVLVSMVVLTGCGSGASAPADTGRNGSTEESIVLLSVTSDAKEDPQSVDMAMKLAGFALDEGRKVVLFFNVKGVTLPTTSFPDDFAFQKDQPIKQQLETLIDRGVDVHVCPVCMAPLGIKDSDLMAGANVTTRPSLFRQIGPGTTVFTY